MRVVGSEGPRDARIARLVDILTCLGSDEAVASDSGVGVVRIAQMVGREKSQVSRALKVLAQSGLVDRDPETLDYRLGYQLFLLAAKASRQRLLAAAPKHLRALVARLGETAHLSVLDGVDVLTLMTEAAPSLVRASDSSGQRVPAHCTSSGRALLLDHERAELEALFGRGALAPRGPRGPRRVEELNRRMGAARERGYAAVVEEFEAGLVGVGAPVRDFRGRIVAALNVSAPAFRFERRLDHAGRQVRASADQLSEELGLTEDGTEKSEISSQFPG